MTTTPRPSLADLGVVEHTSGSDPLAFWRLHCYDGKSEPVEFLFNEEPEHRAVEELMLITDAVSCAVYPPMAAEPATADEAAARLLAVARGMKSISDDDGLAALVSAAAAYQSLYRSAVIAGEELPS